MKKKNKSRLKKYGLLALIIIVLGIVSSQFFSVTTTYEDMYSKYDFKGNEVDLRNGDIRVAPKLYKYSGTQLTWGWLKSNREGILPTYGSISSSLPLEGRIGNKYDTEIIDYGVSRSQNYYCKELGHSNAFSLQSGQRKIDVYETDLEGCDRNTPNYPNDCTYWREESYESYPAVNIWCYNSNDFNQYLKFQSLEPVILDGYYNTFTLLYDVTLNNQSIKAFIVIDNTTYYLKDGVKAFEQSYKPNTKVYYGFELITDKTNTPILSKDIQLKPSFTEPDVEEQTGELEVIDDTPDDNIEDIVEGETQESNETQSNEEVTQDDDTYSSVGSGSGTSTESEDDEQSYGYLLWLFVIALIGGGFWYKLK